MTLHVVVRGVVQGVGFRWFVREHAVRHGLGGWVRNQVDGSVEVVADGDDAAVSALRRALGRGPPGASVHSVVEVPTPANPPPNRPFSILR